MGNRYIGHIETRNGVRYQLRSSNFKRLEILYCGAYELTILSISIYTFYSEKKY
jgi:hypothetical protein